MLRRAGVVPSGHGSYRDPEKIANKMLIDFTLILLQKSDSTVENLTSTRNGANQNHTLTNKAVSIL